MWYVSNAIMRFFIYLHVSLGHLLVKLLGVNLTPLVYDAAFFISVRYRCPTIKSFYVNKPLQYEIKVMKFYSAAANGLGTGAFQKCNWGQIDPMVDRGLKINLKASPNNNSIGLSAEFSKFLGGEKYFKLPFK